MAQHDVHAGQISLIESVSAAGSGSAVLADSDQAAHRLVRS